LRRDSLARGVRSPVERVAGSGADVRLGCRSRVLGSLAGAHGLNDGTAREPGDYALQTYEEGLPAEELTQLGA
jgi:hypothetical protein